MRQRGSGADQPHVVDTHRRGGAHDRADVERVLDVVEDSATRPSVLPPPLTVQPLELGRA